MATGSVNEATAYSSPSAAESGSDGDPMLDLLHCLGPVRTVPIVSLLPADSPRLDGEHLEHAMALAETDGRLPPILVHRGTRRVIDGMHRLLAARLRGLDTIEVRYFDGSVELGFALAVKSNVMHGLPLSLADRRAAAARILAAAQHWSDRAVATITGLSPRTVAGIRRRVAHGTDAMPEPQVRLGRDGRKRPLDTAAGRRRAHEALMASPEASLREIARATGVSPNTVRDVRERMRLGDDAPTPGSAARSTFAHGRHVRSERKEQATASRRDDPAASGRPQVPVRGAARRDPVKSPLDILPSLRRDPSIRLSELGRELLRWLGAQAHASSRWEQFAETVPAHCAEAVAQVATACARDWLEFAQYLEHRSQRAEQDGHAGEDVQPARSRS